MQTNSNMQNSVAMFTFSFFRLEILSLGKFVPVNGNCQYKLKFGIYNSKLHGVVHFFCLRMEYSFWSSLFQTIKRYALPYIIVQHKTCNNNFCNNIWI